MRLVKRFTSIDQTREVRVMYDTEWQEYQCQLSIAGKHYPACTYFAEDKADALSTATLMVNDHSTLGRFSWSVGVS